MERFRATKKKRNAPASSNSATVGRGVTLIQKSEEAHNRTWATRPHLAELSIDHIHKSTCSRRLSYRGSALIEGIFQQYARPALPRRARNPWDDFQTRRIHRYHRDVSTSKRKSTIVTSKALCRSAGVSRPKLTRSILVRTCGKKDLSQSCVRLSICGNQPRQQREKSLKYYTRPTTKTLKCVAIGSYIEQYSAFAR